MFHPFLLMAPTANGEIPTIDTWEWLALPIYIALILLFAYFHQRSKIKDNPQYKYYTWGLLVKIFGGIFFVLIYFYYYDGNGDTFEYYIASLDMRRLLFESPSSWCHIEFGSISENNYALFTSTTGFPFRAMYFELQTLTVNRIVNLILIPGLSSYLLSTVLLAWIAYTGIWKLYIVFTSYYPSLLGKMAIALLFFPSVLFWGSGIIKDTITLSLSGWIVYCIYMIFILKQSKFKFILVLLISLTCVLLIKPYIILAILPGTFVWIFSEKISKIRNIAAKILIIPLIVIACGSLAYFAFASLDNYFGKYALNNINTTLTDFSSDLKQDYYQGHSFDIGNVNNTPTGYIQKIPAAIAAGFYRPFIWESGNIVMLLSSVENLILLFLTLLMFRRTGPIKLLRRLFREPFLFFAFSYSVFFAFGVGLSTSNFGALVRFKIAYLPFFVAALFILSKKAKVIEEDEDYLSNGSVSAA